MVSELQSYGNSSANQNRLNGIRKLWLQSPPKRDDFHDWLHNVVNSWIPKYSVCPEHSNPFDYLFDRYYFDQLKTIGWANRSGGKSYLGGLECWLKARFFPNWGATILGGSKSQSERVYSATNVFWNATDELDGRNVLKKEPLLSKTEFKNHSWYTILGGSTTQALGWHQPNLFLDEVDEIKTIVFNGAMNQPQTMHGYPASWALTSTMHRVGGLMDEWVRNASARGYKVYKWCILETMEGCYGYHCSSCTLTPWCQGRMKDVMALAEAEQIQDGIIDKGDPAKLGYNTVEDTIEKVRNAEIEVNAPMGAIQEPIDIEAALFCNRPSRSGLVFQKEFDENFHVVPADQIHIQTEWPKYRTTDFGFTNPFVSLSVAITPSDELIVYDEYVMTQTRITQHCEYLIEQSRETRFLITVVDPSGATEADEMKAHGIYVAYPKIKDVVMGLNWMRNLLKARPAKLIISSACVVTLSEFLSYAYPPHGLSEIPVDKNNHCLEALRRFVVMWREGSLASVLSLVEGIKLGGGRVNYVGQSSAQDAYQASKDKISAIRRGTARSTAQLP